MNQVKSELALQLVRELTESKIPLAVLSGVTLEATRACREHPTDTATAERRVLIAMEEAGETCQAMLEGRFTDAIAEAEQTAAMFMRLSATLRKIVDGSR